MSTSKYSEVNDLDLMNMNMNMNMNMDMNMNMILLVILILNNDGGRDKLIFRSPVSLSLHEKPIIDFLTNKVTGFNTEGFILKISKA